MKIVTGTEAWENLTRRNRFARWNSAAQNPDFTQTANARLKRRAFVAEYETELRIQAGDKVFCIGSCFARNVEAALRKSGVVVESGMVHGGALATADTFNLYNTESMLNELRWGLDPAAVFGDDGFLPDRDGFADPHTASTGSRTLERCRMLRNDIIATTRRLKDCQFLVITLGLVEAWYDTRNEIYLNVRPPRALVHAEPSRFELHQLDYNDNCRALEAIVALLQQHAQPGVQMMLTVSPVPFVATFSLDDVVVANTYSKSVLRCVAQDFAARHANVHYIPVYDSVVNTDPALAWDDDRIHVDADVVRMNITNFLAKTLSDPRQQAAEKLEHRQARERLLQRKAGPAEPAQATATGSPPDLPAFDLEDAQADAFPQGLPVLRASSSMSEEFGPQNLSAGEAVPWHAQPSTALPQTLDIHFDGPMRCVRLWLQCQDRHPERAPTVFTLFAGEKGVVREQSARITHRWTSGGEWASFAIAFEESWPDFQLGILENGFPQLLTLQRLWLEPATWSTRHLPRAA
jgi:hypothetical protein